MRHHYYTLRHLYRLQVKQKTLWQGNEIRHQIQTYFNENKVPSGLWTKTLASINPGSDDTLRLKPTRHLILIMRGNQ